MEEKEERYFFRHGDLIRFEYLESGEEGFNLHIAGYAPRKEYLRALDEVRQFGRAILSGDFGTVTFRRNGTGVNVEVRNCPNSSLLIWGVSAKSLEEAAA